MVATESTSSISVVGGAVWVESGGEDSSSSMCSSERALGGVKYSSEGGDKDHV
jgi:hypothetical protein